MRMTYFFLAMGFIAITLSVGTGVVRGQDNPNVDTPPMRPEFGPTPLGVQVITADDGFDNFDLGTTNAEPHISMNPLNSLWTFAAFNTNSAFRSTNGTNWIASSPNFGVTAQGDPLTAYDSLGNLYYETMYGGPVGCKIIRSADNGATWTAPVTAIAGNDKNWLACDQTMGPYANYVYTVMTPGRFARSTDFGATWTNTFTASTQTLPGMMAAVGPNVAGGNNISGGCVYVVTHSGSNAAGVYTFYNSTDGGLTFTQKPSNQFSNYIGLEVSGRSTVSAMRCRPYPMIASDNSFGPNRGRLYLVYASNNPSGNGNKSDIFLRYSTDQGTTWSAAVVVNDDPGSQNNFQFHPAIWCDKETGRLYIKFYDTRRVPTSDSMDVYATYTDDGGSTFAPNQRLTNRTFKINFNNAAAPAYKGDYDAINSNRYTSLAVWTDFRNNNYLGMTSYFPDFAMLASTSALFIRPSDSVNVRVTVPSVKLYTNVARFSVSVSPAAPFILTWQGGRDSLTSFPDSLTLKIKANAVPNGTYTVTVVGQGPNGTPVHNRTISINVNSSASSVSVASPNGGENWATNSLRTIQWTTGGIVDSVRIEYSTNNGGLWTSISPGVPATPATYNWTVPNTPTTQALVRVSWTDSAGVNDQSNSPFTISLPPAPFITTTPDTLRASLFVGSNTRVDTLRISNTGTGSLTWSVSDTMAWVFEAPNSGLIQPGNTTPVAVTFNATGRAAGTYSGNLVITSNDPPRSPRNIYVRMTVINMPVGWTTQTSGVTTSLRTIKAVSPQVAWIGGASGVILRTTNGGTSWASVGGGPAIGTNQIYNIEALDQNTAFATSSPAPRTFIYRTTDGGANWTTVYSDSGAGPFIDGIKMTDANNGIAVGDPVGGKWVVLRTTNGGSTWTRIATEPTQVGTETGFNNAVATWGSTHIWFGTNASKTYRSTDDGATWSSTPTAFVSSAGIGFNSPLNGVVGSSSTGNAAARTTDGGATWTPVTIPGTGSAYGFAGSGQDFFAAKGTNVYRSTDGGATWATSFTGSIGTLQHVSMIASGANQYAWTASSTGGIASFFGTVTGVEEDVKLAEIPHQFSLFQNYPNPFNPSTTIRFDIAPGLSTSEAITLKVFDVLGREVATLVNETLAAGKYTVRFETRAVPAGRQGLASGIYFYRLTAGKFIETKKMSLLK